MDASVAGRENAAVGGVIDEARQTAPAILPLSSATIAAARSPAQGRPDCAHQIGWAHENRDRKARPRESNADARDFSRRTRPLRSARRWPACRS